jgi:hypothetical protein
MDTLTEKFYRQFVGQDEQKLLDLIFAPNPTQKDLDELLKVWDIEVKGGNQALILSYLMKEHSRLDFSDYTKPRLEGLLQFYKFNNLKTISQFAKLGKVLNSKGIPLILLKGGAMRFLRPNLPRVMGDIDFLVPQDKFAQTIELAETLGFEKIWDDKHQAPHSIDMLDQETGTSVDIHRYLNLGPKTDGEYFQKFNAPLFSRALKVNAFGVDVLIPAAEDFVFITLANFINNIISRQTISGILFALFDCRFLISQKPDFNWQLVIENAVLTHTSMNVQLAIALINRIVPNLLPNDLAQHLPITNEMQVHLNRILYDEYYFFNYQKVSRKLTLRTVYRHPTKIFNYLSTKPKYLVMKKLVRRRPALIALWLKLFELPKEATANANR